ncbi:MAG: MCE family protein [Candidatus Eisenbacteria sp.]|nr:MCE family protein [Candidatus Eisenbacteria bacterium]
MASRSAELKVGITVIVATVALLAGVAWVGQYRLTKSGFPLQVRFDDVGGLDPGDPVTVAGMERGRVAGIRLEPDAVLVTLWLEADVTLDEQAEIAIENIGMMGEKFVAIRRGGSARPMDVARVQRGVYRPGLMEMMGELGEVVEIVQQEIQGLSAAFSNPSGASMWETLEKLGRTVDELSLLVEENRDDLRAGVQGFREASEEALGFVAEAREETRGALSGVDDVVRGVGVATEEISDLVRSLQALVDRIDEGEGSLGRLVNEDNLHDELIRTLRDLDELIEDVKRNPKKYFGVSVF